MTCCVCNDGWQCMACSGGGTVLVATFWVTCAACRGSGRRCNPNAHYREDERRERERR